MSMQISSANARQWVKNYQTIKRPLLTDSAGTTGETKSISYDIDSWRELTDEAIRRGATGIKVYFAAYSENPVSDEERAAIPPGANKNLTVVFVLTRKDASGIEQDISIEEEPGSPMNILAFDTGSPCPPAVCSNSLS